MPEHVYVVTMPFADHAVGERLSEVEAEAAPAAAVVRAWDLAGTETEKAQAEAFRDRG